MDIEVIDGMKEYADSTGKFTSVNFFVHRVVFFPGVACSVSCLSSLFVGALDSLRRK